MKSTTRIIFYGTPEIAVASLDRLLADGFNVVAVVTAPDRPAGRGLKLRIPEVKEYSISKGLPVLQPFNLKDPDFLGRLRELSPDLQVVVAFRMLPEAVWSLPRLGTFNMHASLLPQYRGAAPINWALINGETETGVTTFFIEKEIDTGKILFAERTPVGPEETAGELHDRLMGLGAGLVSLTAAAICSGTVSAVPQDALLENAVLKTAPKLKKEDGLVSWNADGRTVYNRIRGLSPYPGAFAEFRTIDGQTISLKLLHAEFVPESPAEVPGTVITDGRIRLEVSTGKGRIRLLRVQPSGRKPMEIGEFLRGYGRLFL